MANDLSHILEFDDIFHEKFNEIGNRFMPILAKSEFKSTSQTLIGLMASANSVKLAIFDLAEACDTHLYAIKILQRTLIEHYLKYYYTLFRFIHENTDEVGREYRKFSVISETLGFINASSVANSITGKSTKEQVLKNLRKNYPEYNISKKQIDRIIFKWKHRNIIKYIKDNTEIIKNNKSYLLRLIPLYAELSSFIHGGISAEEYYHTVFSEGKLDETICNIAFETAFMAASMKVHLMLAVCKIDKKFGSDMNSLNLLIEDFLDKSK